MSGGSSDAGSPGGDAPAAPAGVSWNPILLALMALLAAMVFARRWEINHDAALYLHCGRLLLRGMRPYVDFIDLNPPMIMYLSALPSLLAGLLSIHVITAFQLLLLSLVGYSAWMSRRFLQRSGLGLTSVEADLSALAILLFCLYLSRTPTLILGQRESLFLLAYVPFFLTRWIRWSGGAVGSATAVVGGLIAGVGACLKPHMAALAVAMELAQIARHRRWGPLLRPEAFTFVLVGLAYALHFPLLPAEVREAFFERWIPMVSEGYATYNRPWGAVLLRVEVLVAAVTCVAGLAAARGRSNPHAGQARLWALFTAGALALYLVQQKGWHYHRIPLLFGGVATAVAGGCAMAFDRGVPIVRINTVREVRMITVGLLAAAVVMLVPRMGEGFRPWRDPGLGRMIRNMTPEGAPVLMLSTTVGEIYPLLLQIEREGGSRYLWTFPIPMLYHGVPGGEPGAFPYRSKQEMGAQEQRFLDELSADIARKRPALIMIDAYEKPQGCPEGFTLPGYFKAAGFIAGEMAGYRYAESMFGWDVYVPANKLQREAGTAENG